MSESLIDIIQRLLVLPTAHFHEHHILAEVHRFAAERSLIIDTDEVGNITLSTVDAAPSGLCLTAHMDHPALGFGVHESTRDILFEKLGGLPVDLARKARVLLYETTTGTGLADPVGGGSVTAFLEEGVPGATAEFPLFRVRVDEEVPEGELFAVWDLTPCAFEGTRIIGTACDDLVGVAVALATLERCLEIDMAVSVLLTRAEETGFGGMLAAVSEGNLERDLVYVNIECSSCRAGAPLGAGPVIRVGDRRWVFDAGVTGALATVARDLDGKNESFRVQRRLMDGGVCEATPLSHSGRATGAVALPLDNYHNNGGDALRPEAVHLDDAENLVTLLTGLASQPQGARAVVDASTRQLNDMFLSHRVPQIERLKQTMPTIGKP